ncbi:MAG: histidine kinase dimerization/phospho-acceptor domain-containing protein, partial [candidate division WOR-3 bacterium]
MEPKLGIAVCARLQPVASAVLETAEGNDVRLVTFPADCAVPFDNWQTLAASLAPLKGETEHIQVLGGKCLAGIQLPADEHGRCQFHDLGSCPEPEAGHDSVQAAALLVRLVYNWRLESQRAKLNSILASAYRRLTDHTMVQELIGNLAETLAEDKVVEKVFELFTVLLAPERMAFASMDEGRVLRVWTRPPEPENDPELEKHLGSFRRAYAWTPDGNGFTISIRHRSKTLGVLQINGISQTEYKEHYLDLALTIARVCGMTISNARLYRELKGPNRLLAEFAEDLQDALTARKRAEERQAELLKQVESANKELAEFAYIVSHDLKAPLRAIDSLVRWLGQDYADKFDEDGREQLELLLGRVKRMHALIDGILQYSRVGRVREQPVEIDLARTVPEIIDLLAPPAHIKVVVENELPVITGEKTRIEQLFQNLLSNAIKYMDKPEGLIRVGCIDDGAMWKFYVADNGP